MPPSYKPKTNRIMNKKKNVAGVDRPYTAKEIGEMLCEWVKEGDFERKACLEYFNTELSDDVEIKREDFRFFSITDFGANEGVYTSFFIEYIGKDRIWCMTSKTLDSSEQGFLNMSKMAAHLCYRFHKFAEKNINNFVWYGYDLSCVADGKETTFLWCPNMDRVRINAKVFHDRTPGSKLFYTDMETREKKEYKF